MCHCLPVSFWNLAFGMDGSVARPHPPRRLFALSLTPTTTTTYSDTPTHHPHPPPPFLTPPPPARRRSARKSRRGRCTVLSLSCHAAARPASDSSPPSRRPDFLTPESRPPRSFLKLESQSSTLARDTIRSYGPVLSSVDQRSGLYTSRLNLSLFSSSPTSPLAQSRRALHASLLQLSSMWVIRLRSFVRTRGAATW